MKPNDVVLESDDIFCGDTFVMTLDRFSTLDISIKNGRLFINNTFVKDFTNQEDAKLAIEDFLKVLNDEDVDIMLSVS